MGDNTIKQDMNSSMLILLWFIMLFNCNVSLLHGQEVMDCEDQFRNITSSSRSLPCICQRDFIYNGTIVNCDGIAFFGDFPLLPFRQRIVVFSQRYSGVQNLEAQLFTASNIPLKKVDFSHNLLRRLMERTFDGIEKTLEELILSNNLLGDQLNPIFSTNEFQQLNALRILDLSYNQLRALDSNIFKGLKNISVLNLEGNELTEVPTLSFHGLTTLRSLKLGNNYISNLKSGIFSSSLASMKELNLSRNSLSTINSGAFSGLHQLTNLYLAYNQLKSLNSQIFSVLTNLQILDLSNNFLDYFPTEALIGLRKLKKLNLSMNNIQAIEENAFDELKSLENLDLNRNSINILASSAFNALLHLKKLNLGYNSLRKIEENDENVFGKLTKLEQLDINDCQVWQFPSVSIQGLIHLKRINLDYNNIEIVSQELINSLSHVEELSIAFNLIQDLPDDLFRNFQNLRLLNLHGNKIDFISQDILHGISDNIIAMDLGFNDIKDWPKLSMPKLYILSITMNQITKIETESFYLMPSLVHLNLSFNQITYLPVELFKENQLLEYVDLQGNSIQTIHVGIFFNRRFIKINLSGNKIKELSQSSFKNLTKLQHLDVSSNEITVIKNGAFDSLSSLKSLDLSKNGLTSLKGDFFTTRTQLESFDLSFNQISYLYPNSFTVHRKLKSVNLSHNKLTFFPIEIINSIRTLEHINLSNNRIQFISQGDFSNMPKLKTLELQNNQITEIESKSFENSTQLQWLYLQNNQIFGLNEKTFTGIARLNLDISSNNLTFLPGDLFNRHTNVFQLESINLARNQFNQLPTTALKKQYSFLERVNLSRNRIVNLPSNSDVLVNVKELDLSFNPLSNEAHSVLFGEPKSVRKLYVSGANIETLPTVIESPFLKELNLSNNNISKIKSTTFERTSLLQKIDLSYNKITNLNNNINGVWNSVSPLKYLSLSSNPIQYIVKGDLDQLVNLEVLDLSKLPNLMHFDCETFSQLHQLKILHLFGYPSLNFLEIQSCLENINNKLEKLAVEMKDSNLQGHLQRAFSTRINEILITGNKLTSISPSSLSGIKSPKFKLKLQNTSLNNLPPTLFSSLPLSTQVDVNLNDNEITSLNSQLINLLQNKQSHIKLMGLNKNPLVCDCKLQPIWKLINEKMRLNSNAKYYVVIDSISNLSCTAPSHLRGYQLSEINYEDLTCSSTSNVNGNGINIKVTTSSSIHRHTAATTLSSLHHRITPDIIFEVPSSKKPFSPGLKGIFGRTTNDRRQNLTKFDTVVIGIVVGVSAFVVILILIVCIFRLRSNSSSTLYPTPITSTSIGCSAVNTIRGHPAGHHCTCLKPWNHQSQPCYFHHPQQVYNGTMRHAQPIKMMSVPPAPSALAPSLHGNTLGKTLKTPKNTYYHSANYPNDSEFENR